MRPRVHIPGANPRYPRTRTRSPLSEYPSYSIHNSMLRFLIGDFLVTSARWWEGQMDLPNMDCCEFTLDFYVDGRVT